MKTAKHLTVLLALFFTSQLSAQSASEIVQRSEDHLRGKTNQAGLIITTTRPKWTRSMEIQTWAKGTEYAMIIVKSPAREKGTAFLKRKKEVWNWLPNLERTIKLPPSMMSQSWMGTDFTNDDLVKEASAVHDYTHKMIDTVEISGLECYKILLTPKEGAAVVWGKVIVWIDSKDYMQIRTEFFDERGKMVNIMKASDFKTMGGRKLPGKLTMIPKNKKGHKTTIEYKWMEFDKPISGSFFTTAQMSKL